MRASFLFRWTGRAMEPLTRFLEYCQRDFVEGSTYRLEPVGARNQESHDHFFAVMHLAYDNLTTRQKEEWPKFDYFRKWCLIQAGFYYETRLQADTQENLNRYVKALSRLRDYRVVVMAGDDVLIREAESQATQAMGPARFEASKQGVFDIVAALIGVHPTELKKEARRQ